MESLWILIPLSLVIAIGIGAVFWWAVSGGQMDDLDSPAQRILIDDDSAPRPTQSPDAPSSASAKPTETTSQPTSNKALPVV
jgi:cbb3-type cytochrome oxidase maturation protein